MQIRKITTRCQSGLRAISPNGSALFVVSASMSGLVLTPIAVLAAVLGAWRFGADPGWTTDFFISGGLFSRYQLWFAIAIGAQASALLLNRWAANHLRVLVP